MRGDVYLGKLLEFHKMCRGPFGVPRETWAFFGNNTAQKGLLKHAGENFIVCVELWGEAEGSSRVACQPGGPLVSPQGRQISFGVARGTSGFLVHRCRDEYGLILSRGGNLRVPLHLKFDLRVSAELEHESQASSCVVAQNSVCLSSC